MANESVRTFISYSWSSPTHESWVLSLASRLRQDGVDAILDKWDLQHGHDALKFMEQMVADPTVKKVLMICDRVYSEKSNAREGGVGAESQIISPELYGKSVQNKFAAAITELDDQGKAYIPIFYKGRIYFDFSSDEKYEEQYEALLRWIVGKPLHIKPSLGEVPSYLEGGLQNSAATESKFKRVINAIRQNSKDAPALFKDFSDAIFTDFERLRISGIDKDNFQNEIIKSITVGRVYVDQMLALTLAIARHSDAADLIDYYVRTLEKLARFTDRPEHVASYTNWDFDNYIFLCHEIFVGSVAALLNEERFDLVTKLLTHPYLITGGEGGGRATESFASFSTESRCMPALNQERNRLDVRADLLKERHEGRSPSFVDFMQADLVLYLYSRRIGEFWDPCTLVYASMRYRPFDVFARSESRHYFSRVLPMLGGGTAEEFKELVNSLRNDRRGIPTRIPFGRLSNFENLGSIP